MGTHIMSGRKLIEKTENPSNVPNMFFEKIKFKDK